MTKTLHARLESKNSPDEIGPLQYSCMELPCITTGIIYTYEQLQRHAESFHNAFILDVDMATARRTRIDR